MAITITPIVNEFGQSSLLIEAEEPLKFSHEFEILRDFFNKLNAKKQGKKLVAGIDTYERMELSVPRHELPESQRQDLEENFDIKKVSPAFKHNVFDIVINAIVQEQVTNE